MIERSSAPPAFSAPYVGADEDFAARLFAEANLPPDTEAEIDGLARFLLEHIRAVPHRLGAIEDFLHEYSLSTEEGLALMVLAEALLRVPDDATADRLIEDKLAQPAWSSHAATSEALLVQASAWALGLTAHAIARQDDASSTVQNLARRIGMSAVRQAARQAMHILGAHFILGRTIEDAVHRAEHERGHYSFDMLGEGARTAEDADAYFQSYAHAIDVLAANASRLAGRPGISIKLSALHPRFEAISRLRVMTELVPRLIQLVASARAKNIAVTIDAEEADRLELSLDVFEALCQEPDLAGWAGFGLAVQAYQKRAKAVLDFVFDLARHYDRRFAVRLVKGAYWDTEIKRAQERGLVDYPVFSRKAMTDLHYIVCAQKLLDARERIFPQFATHNALTVASIVARAGGAGGYEFQRLHGMGAELYRALRENHPEIPCRVYAPVGTYRDLLAYLVRRLLENGANSSFVAKARDTSIPIETLLRRPQALIETPNAARSSYLPLPLDLQMPERKLAPGLEFGDENAVEDCVAAIAAASEPVNAASLIDGKEQSGTKRPALSPIDGAIIGQIVEANLESVAPAMAAASAGFRAWSQTTVEKRATCLDRMADSLEREAPRFLSLLQNEGGKTLDDAVAELREAVDYCRYYAALARRLFAVPEALAGPTGESNRLEALGRGVFLGISPWNFPLAIFLGQVAAALVCGNSVIAKPSEQTPLIAAEAIRAFHRADVPASALHLMLGDGKIGAALVEDPRVAGVVFTGSTEVAWHINRALAAKAGPIVPLIAETGGINAMIVDATALPEQVTDDVIASAFRSTGQRCSALRLLCLQEDVAESMLAMIAGAARELAIGDPRDLSIHIGPVIDQAAKEALQSAIAKSKSSARLVYAGEIPQALRQGLYVAPHIFEIDKVADLDREIFGPVLHVVRYKADRLDALLEDIERLGYGLTLGIHSRIDSTIAKIAARHLAGNCYVNRSMIGAVVGTQPFGGFGLSGTGPKAGGPHYLSRFIREQTLTVNTAAAGGNATLITAEE
ncbi:MAG: bifunctional proline dehydrogenase/L-glutamate gamma-semialdehyde dehydrogenase PutA [Methylovirgula sp.]|jgi:RHH-type proline utilization regulon transcriptional repressor/proline dehydrogenase/delta 1-pyrroline-5-carboxylate dehydrogenase